MKNKVLFCRVSEATHNLVKERAGDQGITNFLECAIHSYLNKRDEQIIDAIVDGVVGELERHNRAIEARLRGQKPNQ